MSYRDNEFYKGVGDGEPTLQPERQTAELNTSDEWKSAAADASPTCEVEDVEAIDTLSGRKSGVRKVVKMLKLTAAVLVTVTVAAGSVGGIGKLGGSKKSFNPTQEWPSITYTHDADEEGFTTVYSTNARNANVVQFNIDGRAFRLEDTTKSLTFMWNQSRDDFASLLVRDQNAGVSYSISISASPYSAAEQDSKHAYGTISSTTGDVFYLEARSHFYRKTGQLISTSAELASLMHQLVVRSYISAADEENWGKLLVGDTLYSDLDADWSGLEDYDSKDNDYPIYLTITDREWDKVDLTEELCTITVNDIEWTICVQKDFNLSVDDEFGSEYLWLVPLVEGERAVIGQEANYVLWYLSYHNINASMDELTPELVTALAEELLSHFHIAPSEWRR